MAMAASLIAVGNTTTLPPPPAKAALRLLSTAPIVTLTPEGVTTVTLATAGEVARVAMAAEGEVEP